MATQADVVDYIKNLKLSEVKDLISVLEDELGVEASAPMMMGVAGPGAAAEEVAEQTEFNVVLTDFGGSKIKVIKCVRSETGLASRKPRIWSRACPQ